MAAVTPQVFDSSGLQNIASAMPDVVGSTANAYKLKDMADTSQMNTLKLAEAKRDITVREQTNEALRNLPLNATQEQRMQAVEKIRQGPGGYGAAMDVMRNFGVEDKAAADRASVEAITKKHLADASQQTFESYVAKNDAFDGSFLPVWQKFNDLVATGMPIAQAKAAVQPDYQRAYVGAISATDAAGNLIYNDPGSKQKFQSLGTTFDPDKLGPEIMQSEKVRKQLAEAQQARVDIAHKKAETGLAEARTQNIRTAGSKAFTEDEGDLMAALADRGVTIPSGFKGKEQQKALYAGLIRKHPGMTVDDIADGIKSGAISMIASRAEAQVVGRREGSTAVALDVLTAPVSPQSPAGGLFIQLKKAAQKLDFNNNKIQSKIRLAFQEGYSDDPDIQSYKNLIEDVRAEYAVGLAKGGVSTEGSNSRAKEIWPDAMSYATLEQNIKTSTNVLSAIANSNTRVIKSITSGEPLSDVARLAQPGAASGGAKPVDKAGYDALPKGARYTMPGDPTVRVKQ